MHTLALAGSRDRLALTIVETFEVRDRPDGFRTVTLSGRLPADVGPREAYAAVVQLADAVKEQNNGSEPRVIIQYSGIGPAVYGLLKEDYRQQRRRERPMAITTYAAANDNVAHHVTPARLASQLFTAWENDRINFADGLDKLRAQMAAFVPVASKAGNLGFGNEDMSDYDDTVVSLMFATAVKGYGVPKFVDAQGRVWPSRAIAWARLGTAALDVPEGPVLIRDAQ